MALENSMKNKMLDQMNECTYLSLHSAYPATQANEITGGSPAYARKAISWNAGANGAKIVSNAPIVFDVPACTVSAIGYNTAITGGTLHGGDDVVQEIFAAQGNYTVSSAQVSLP